MFECIYIHNGGSLLALYLPTTSHGTVTKITSWKSAVNDCMFHSYKFWRILHHLPHKDNKRKIFERRK
jgi:hypothetical protein